MYIMIHLFHADIYLTLEQSNLFKEYKLHTNARKTLDIRLLIIIKTDICYPQASYLIWRLFIETNDLNLCVICFKTHCQLSCFMCLYYICILTLFKHLNIMFHVLFRVTDMPGVGWVSFLFVPIMYLNF